MRKVHIILNYFVIIMYLDIYKFGTIVMMYFMLSIVMNFNIFFVKQVLNVFFNVLH